MKRLENGDMVFNFKEVARIMLALRHSENLLKDNGCETLAMSMKNFRLEIEKVDKGEK